MKSYKEWSSEKLSLDNFKTITITCRDKEDSLEELINYIKNNGNIGHSFSIVVDPKSDASKNFYWDGDGSDYIKDIKVSK